MRTLKAAFACGDWAWNELTSRLSGLDDAQLDQPFEMGLGTLRATYHHVAAAERVWLERWQQRTGTAPLSDGADESIAQIAARFAQTARARNEFLAGLDHDGLDRRISYQNLRGESFESSFRVMLMHVGNHGAHHRAQMLNMLRHVGVKPPWLDFLAYWKSRDGGGEFPGALETLRQYAAYGDWAQEQVLAACATLPAELLDQPFEMGPGSLRATLLHIRFAEQWWLQNRRSGPGQPLPELPPDTHLDRLAALWRETAAERNADLARLAEADLATLISARPRPDVLLTFPLGAVLLQLVFHGTHHRAQALNMLRRVGVAPPPLDLILWSRS